MTPNAESDAGPKCTCPHGPAPGGTLYGIRMGRVPNARLSDEPGCPVHDPRTHPFTDPYPDGPPAWHVPPLLCKFCGVPKRKHTSVTAPGETAP